MASSDETSTPNINKILAAFLAAMLGGGSWGTIELRRLVDEVRDLRGELAHVRAQQAKAATETTGDIATLKAEVAGMRRDIDRLNVSR